MFEFRDPAILAPIGALASLRNEVLARSEKRMPKWKLRLAADLVMELQPRPGPKTLFEGRVLKCAGATAHMLAQSKFRPRPFWLLRFAILDASENEWTWKYGGATWSNKADRSGLDDMRARLITALQSGELARGDAATWFSGFCLCCGKALTDPASRARMIGPECFGSGSLQIPWVRDLQAAE